MNEKKDHLKLQRGRKKIADESNLHLKSNIDELKKNLPVKQLSSQMSLNTVYLRPIT